MTRKVIYLVLPFLLFTFTSTANATTTLISPPNSQQEKINQQTKMKQQYQIIQEQNLGATNEAKMLRDEFKQHLQIIKDQKKKALVERIDTKIAEVNKNQTSRFTEILARLQGFLDATNKLATDSSALTKITTAQNIINAAKLAVDTQTQKIYTMTIADDATLKQNAGIIVSQFRQEITAVYKLVIEAKQAVQNLHVEKVLIKKEATTSANL